jgi:flavin-dependent dehydrogenase
MNVLKIKGSHTAIKSGIEAGKSIYDKLILPPTTIEHPKIVEKYQTNM